MGADTRVGGLLGALAPIGMFVGSLVVGTMTDLVGRRQMLIGCTAWFSALTALCALAPSPEVFGALRFLAGLGLGGVLPKATALAGEYAPLRVRNLAYGLIFTGFPLGGILAALIGIGLIPRPSVGGHVRLGHRPTPRCRSHRAALPAGVRGFLAARRRTAEAERIAARHGMPVPPRTVAGPQREDAPDTGKLAPVAELVSRRYRLATACF